MNLKVLALAATGIIATISVCLVLAVHHPALATSPEGVGFCQVDVALLQDPAVVAANRSILEHQQVLNAKLAGLKGAALAAQQKQGVQELRQMRDDLGAEPLAHLHRAEDEVRAELNLSIIYETNDRMVVSGARDVTADVGGRLK